MHAPESDLDRLTRLIGQCLGRIDAEAYRLQNCDLDECLLIGDLLEAESATLHELVDSLLERAGSEERTDLNLIVERAVRSCLAETGVPVVVRQRLEPGLPSVACDPGPLSFAVRRALSIAVGRLQPGGEIVLQTRRDDQGVVLELECRGIAGGNHLAERTVTLCEFVADLQGRCRVHDHQGSMLLMLELPAVFSAGEVRPPHRG
jgi:nitrogen-specific signal transduction histidine kinase